jgi:hypothetical protein
MCAYVYIYIHIIVIIIYTFILFIYHSYHSYTFIIYIYTLFPYSVSPCSVEKNTDDWGIHMMFTHDFHHDSGIPPAETTHHPAEPPFWPNPKTILAAKDQSQKHTAIMKYHINRFIYQYIYIISPLYIYICLIHIISESLWFLPCNKG